MDIQITLYTNTQIEAMQRRKSMHIQIPENHTHTSNTQFLSVSYAHLDWILNTNTVVQMTEAYFINQKNPQEKYLNCCLLSLL